MKQQSVKANSHEFKQTTANELAIMKPPKSILIIEDDLSVIDFLETVFQHLRPEVSVDYATSVNEAMEKIRSRPTILGESPYSLVIADIFLEGDETGFESWVACSKEFPNMPFVFTSSLSIDRYLSILSGFDQCPTFLPKPLTITRCRSVIEEFV